MASINQRGKCWRARVRIPGFKQKTRTFDTREEAVVWAMRIEQGLRAGVDTIPDLRLEMTLGDALERYLKEVTPQKKGWEQEGRRIRAWQRRPALAQLKLSKLSSGNLVEFKKERKKEGTASNTIRLDLALISNLYKVARQEWNMPYLRNPIAEMRLPKPGKPRNRRLSAEEAQRFTEALKGCRNRLAPLVIRFAVETAARQGEILRLLKSDVDLNKRVAVFRDTKNGTDRAVPLSKGALAVLKQLEPSAGSAAFPITRNALVAAWRRTLQRANIEDFRFHDLRHEGTTALFERGLEVMEVQQITGHKTLRILLDYTHMNPCRLVDRLDETEARSARAAKGRAMHGADAPRLAQADEESDFHNANPIAQNPGQSRESIASPRRVLHRTASGMKYLASNVIVFPKRE